MCPRSRQPLAGPRPRRWTRRLSATARAIAPTHTGPTRVDPGIPLARAGGVRLPRSGLDLRPHRQGHRVGVRRPLPQGPCRPLLKPSAGRRKSRSSGPSSGTTGDSTLARRGLAATAPAPPRAPGAVFEDESGFYLLPGWSRPTHRKATPVLREKQTRDHLSSSGMTPEGRVYTLIREESLNSLHCIEFLLHLLRVAGQRLLVIWDSSPIHRRVEVKDFVASTQGRCGWRPCRATPPT